MEAGAGFCPEGLGHSRNRAVLARRLRDFGRSYPFRTRGIRNRSIERGDPNARLRFPFASTKNCATGPAGRVNVEEDGCERISADQGPDTAGHCGAEGRHAVRLSHCLHDADGAAGRRALRSGSGRRQRRHGPSRPSLDTWRDARHDDHAWQGCQARRRAR